MMKTVERIGELNGIWLHNTRWLFNTHEWITWWLYWFDCHFPPPYDNLRNYNEFTWDFGGIAKELFRITKDGGVVVWIVGDATIKGSETGSSFKQALFFMECGFNLHDTMIYQKDACPFPEINRYYPSFEYMFVLSKGKPKTTNLIMDKPKHQKSNQR